MQNKCKNHPVSRKRHQMWLAVRRIYSSTHCYAIDSFLLFPLGLLSVAKISGKKLSACMRCDISSSPDAFCNSDSVDSSQAQSACALEGFHREKQKGSQFTVRQILPSLATRKPVLLVVVQCCSEDAKLNEKPVSSSPSSEQLHEMESLFADDLHISCSQFLQYMLLRY